ncbi:MAG: hypothetical protein JO032_04210, partial [Alphaproteobacteria bacterium]|nr:hypothetical protein [Alphaproteobacteria bacterium]
TANAGQVSGAFAGFVNKLRGNSLSQWYGGTSMTIATSGGWASEGVYVVPAGASVTASQAVSPQSGAPYFALKILGAASNTDVKLRFPIESYSAAVLAGQTVTFQITYQNKSGGSLTPTLTTKYAGAQDNWTSPTTDLSAGSMQSCANNAVCTAAYTLAVAAGANNGYTPTVDFGALTSGNYIEIVSFDMRVTAGVATGPNAAPPTPEYLLPSDDAAWCRRFYQTTYDNGTAPGTATHSGLVGGFNYDRGVTTFVGVSLGFPIPLRASPTVSFWDGAGNSGRESVYVVGSGFTDNVAAAPSAAATSTQGMVLGQNTTDSFLIHYAADARIAGA